MIQLSHNQKLGIACLLTAAFFCLAIKAGQKNNPPFPNKKTYDTTISGKLTKQDAG